MGLDASGLLLNVTPTFLSFDYTLSIEDYVLQVTVDRGYMIDGVAILPPLANASSQPYSLPLAPGFALAVNDTQAYCANHWTTLLYDPTFNGLFFGVPAVKSEAHTITLALATVLPILAVLVLAVILLVIFVEPVRALVRPYSKGRVLEGSATQ